MSDRLRIVSVALLGLITVALLSAAVGLAGPHNNPGPIAAGSATAPR